MSKKESVPNRQYTDEFKVEAVRLGERSKLSLFFAAQNSFDDCAVFLSPERSVRSCHLFREFPSVDGSSRSARKPYAS